MALIIGTNQSTAGNLYVLSTGDNFLLPANVVAHSTGASGSGVIATAGGHDLTIDGTLIGSLAGVSMGGIDTDIGNRLTINATGTVAGSTFFAVRSLGGQASISNAGLITGNIGIAMFADSGTGSMIINSGRIISEDRAIDHRTGLEKLTLINTGTITSYDSFSYDTDNAVSAVDIVINKGTMNGKVYLGGGSDIYEGDGGRVFGGGGYDVFGGAGNDILRGGAFADILDGGSGIDSITGRLGKDILEGGGAEADSFYYLAVAEVGDTILDFTTADYLRFKSTAFGNATLGTCSLANFRSNTTGLAQDADDRFIYETDRDILWFDANGTGAGGQILVTDFAYDVNLTRADIIIF